MHKQKTAHKRKRKKNKMCWRGQKPEWADNKIKGNKIKDELTLKLIKHR